MYFIANRAFTCFDLKYPFTSVFLAFCIIELSAMVDRLIHVEHSLVFFSYFKQQIYVKNQYILNIFYSFFNVSRFKLSRQRCVFTFLLIRSKQEGQGKWGNECKRLFKNKQVKTTRSLATRIHYGFTFWFYSMNLF